MFKTDTYFSLRGLDVTIFATNVYGMTRVWIRSGDDLIEDCSFDCRSEVMPWIRATCKAFRKGK